MLLIELTLAAALAAVVTVRVPVTSLTLVPAGKPRRQHPYGTYFTSYGDIRKHYMRLKVTRLQPDTPGDWLFSFGQSGRRIFTLDAFVFGIGRYDQPYPGKGEDEWMTSEHAFVWGKSWFVTLTLALYPTWVLMRIMIDRTRRHRRREVGLCTKCGYNLTGNVSGRCPECGKEPVAADSVE
ncbi:MAG: hypothetical protein IID41_14655 [Planctomycetes bacterium]|nr:hypothetical protein [Planctomycetota bacterium]